MISLILRDETVIATVLGEVTVTSEAVVSDEGLFPFSAGVTGATVVGSLPPDFRPDRYVWRDGGLVRLPDPPPSQEEIDRVTALRREAYRVESDDLFMAWQAAIAASSPTQDAKKAAWLAARSSVQARYPYPDPV